MQPRFMADLEWGHPGLTRLELVEEERARRGDELAEQITTLLDDVDSLDQDRILRSYLALIQATLRTSFFQRGVDSRPKSYVAFKLDPQATLATTVSSLKRSSPLKHSRAPVFVAMLDEFCKVRNTPPSVATAIRGKAKSH